MAFKRKQLLIITGSETIEGPEYEMVWHILTDTVDDGPFAVRTYVGYKYGDVYSYGNELDILAICTRISEQPMGSSKVDWEVKVNFTRPPKEEAGERSESDNPLLDPPQVEWGYEDRKRTVFVDVNGKPIVNPVGDTYDELIEIDDFRRTLTVVRNEQDFPRALADALSNKTNKTPWNTYAPKTVKLKPITATRQWNTAIGAYWAVRYEFVMAAIGETWDSDLVSKGFNHYETAGDPDTKQRILVDSEPSVESQLLLANGTLWKIGDPVHSKKWEVIPNADFALLDLAGVV